MFAAIRWKFLCLCETSVFMSSTCECDRVFLSVCVSETKIHSSVFSMRVSRSQTGCEENKTTCKRQNSTTSFYSNKKDSASEVRRVQMSPELSRNIWVSWNTTEKLRTESFIFVAYLILACENQVWKLKQKVNRVFWLHLPIMHRCIQ